MHLTCYGSNLNYSRHCPAPPSLPCHNALLLLRFRKKGPSELLTGSTFYFLWPSIRAISAGAPKLHPPLFPVTLNHWFHSVAGQSLWDVWILHPLQMAVPSPVTYSGWRGKDDYPEEQWGIRVIKTMWAFPESLIAARTPPSSAQGNQAGPCPAS